MVFVDDIDAKHVPDNVPPIIEGAFGNFHTSADVCISEPSFVQFLEGNFLPATNGLYHPDVFIYQALSSFVISHIFSFFCKNT
jgi:hypothetical protein